MRKRNWSKYNTILVNRGRVTFLIEKSSLSKLVCPKKRRRVGRPTEFSDELIKFLLLFKIHYGLSYRMLQGFIETTLPAYLPTTKLPTYSLICKRAPNLLGQLGKLTKRRPSVIILDASGVKIMGEGEWKVKVHGEGKAGKWVKIHIAMDADSQEITALELTPSNTHDSQVVQKLLDGTSSRIKEVLGDKAYDSKAVREEINRRGAKALVPPRSGAVCRGDGSERDNQIMEIMGLGNDDIALGLWKKLTRYGRRSLVESAFSRWKRLFGERMFSRELKRMEVEVHLKSVLLNKMFSV